MGGDVPLPGADDVGAHVPMLAAYTPIHTDHLLPEQSPHEAARCLLVRHCCQSSHDNLCIIKNINHKFSVNLSAFIVELFTRLLSHQNMLQLQ